MNRIFFVAVLVASSSIPLTANAFGDCQTDLYGRQVCKSPDGQKWTEQFNLGPGEHWKNERGTSRHCMRGLSGEYNCR
jgi:hypothetical protein